MLVGWINHMVRLGRYDRRDTAPVNLDEVVSMLLPKIRGYFCFGSGYVIAIHLDVRRIITRHRSLSFQRVITLRCKGKI